MQDSFRRIIMQDPISFEEITQLYEACGANLSRQQELRTTINTGTLNNKLNTNCDFLNKSLINRNGNFRKSSLEPDLNCFRYLLINSLWNSSGKNL